MLFVYEVKCNLCHIKFLIIEVFIPSFQISVWSPVCRWRSVLQPGLFVLNRNPKTTRITVSFKHVIYSIGESWRYRGCYLNIACIRLLFGCKKYPNWTENMLTSLLPTSLQEFISTHQSTQLFHNFGMLYGITVGYEIRCRTHEKQGRMLAFIYNFWTQFDPWKDMSVSIYLFKDETEEREETTHTVYLSALDRKCSWLFPCDCSGLNISFSRVF